LNAAIAEDRNGADLTAIAASLDKDAAEAKTPADAERLRALAAIMKARGSSRP
jgi:hypothetical protein